MAEPAAQPRVAVLRRAETREPQVPITCEEDATCPISYELMYDPVQVQESKRIYERTALLFYHLGQLVHGQQTTCPYTCIPALLPVIPMSQLRDKIQEFALSQGRELPRPYRPPAPLLNDLLASTLPHVQHATAEEVELMFKQGLSRAEAQALLPAMMRSQVASTTSVQLQTLAAQISTTCAMWSAETTQEVQATAMRLATAGCTPRLVELLGCHQQPTLQIKAAVGLQHIAATRDAAVLLNSHAAHALVLLLKETTDPLVRQAAHDAIQQFYPKFDSALGETMAAALHKQIWHLWGGDTTHHRVGMQLVHLLITECKPEHLLKLMAVLKVHARLVGLLLSADTAVQQMALHAVQCAGNEPQLLLLLFRAGLLTVLPRMVAEGAPPVEAAARKLLAALCSTAVESLRRKPKYDTPELKLHMTMLLALQREYLGVPAAMAGQANGAAPANTATAAALKVRVPATANRAAVSANRPPRPPAAANAAAAPANRPAGPQPAAANAAAVPANIAPHAAPPPAAANAAAAPANRPLRPPAAANAAAVPANIAPHAAPPPAAANAAADPANRPAGAPPAAANRAPHAAPPTAATAATAAAQVARTEAQAPTGPPAFWPLLAQAALWPGGPPAQQAQAVRVPAPRAEAPALWPPLARAAL